jgi:hypothetical protein
MVRALIEAGKLAAKVWELHFNSRHQTGCCVCAELILPDEIGTGWYRFVDDTGTSDPHHICPELHFLRHFS